MLGKSYEQCRRPGFSPWVGRISWRRAPPPTPAFLVFICLFLAVPGLRCGSGSSLVVASRGDVLVAVSRLLTAVASLAAGPEGSAVAARGL